MIQRIRAHFDGQFIVPDEPVDLPINEPLQVQFSSLPTQEESDQDQVIADRLHRLRLASGCISAPPIPAEALRREHLYDERL